MPIDLKYIPDTLNFYPVTKDKYNDCRERSVGDSETELFAGDLIIGMYNKKQCLCLYEWKKDNNPREITGYCFLRKIEITEEINDVTFFKTL